MKKTDVQILTALRSDGRIPLTVLSKRTKLPVSTIHDRLKSSMRDGSLRPTVLLNFEKLGFAARAYILLAVEQSEKDKLFAHLKMSPCVNCLFRINNGWNLMMECVFKDMNSMEAFVEQLESVFHIKQKQVHYVLEEVKRESFFTEFEPSVKMLV